MANKIEIDKLDSISANDAAAVASINRNFEKVQAAINNSLSRDGTVPNFMDADLDLNTHRIINGATPVDDGDFVTLEYFKENVGESANNAAAAEQAALRAASSAQSASISANNALASADAAAQSAQQAANTVSGFDTHYAEKVQEFDNNAQQKVDAYNQNDTTKTAAFDANAVAKTQEFDTNAQQKLDSFNTNAAQKQAAVDASAAAAKQSEDNAEIWAEGTDEQVQALGGIHSAKGWAEANEFPDQAGQAGKYLTTDGSKTSWGDAAKIDLSNVNTIGKEFISAQGKPSGRNVSVELGASGSTYTAPANGWFFCNATVSSDSLKINFVRISNVTVGIAIQSIVVNTTSTLGHNVYIPCKNGDSILIEYSGALSGNFTRFIYDAGDE